MCPFQKQLKIQNKWDPWRNYGRAEPGATCMGQAHNLSLCFFPASRSSYFLRSASNTCWHQVSESLGLNVPIYQGHKFLRSQGLSVSRSQDLRVFKVPGFQGRKTSRSQAFKITLNILRSPRFPKIYQDLWDLKQYTGISKNSAYTVCPSRPDKLRVNFYWRICITAWCFDQWKHFIPWLLNGLSAIQISTSCTKDQMKSFSFISPV